MCASKACKPSHKLSPSIPVFLKKTHQKHKLAKPSQTNSLPVSSSEGTSTLEPPLLIRINPESVLWCDQELHQAKLTSWKPLVLFDDVSGLSLTYIRRIQKEHSQTYFSRKAHAQLLQVELKQRESKHAFRAGMMLTLLMLILFLLGTRLLAF